VLAQIQIQAPLAQAGAEKGKPFFRAKPCAVVIASALGTNIRVQIPPRCKNLQRKHSNDGVYIDVLGIVCVIYIYCVIYTPFKKY
jgi:hypothetical protein